MKKFTLLLTLLFINTIVFAQLKNYTIKDNAVVKEKAISEETQLKITESHTIFEKTIEKSNVGPEEFEIAAVSGVATALIGLVSNLPSYANQILERRKKQFQAEYNAKNTNSLLTTIKESDGSITLKAILPKLNLIRSFYNTKNEKKPAMSLTLEPNILQKKYLAFSLKDLNLNYSKAKITKGYNFVNLLITVKVIYTKEKSKTNEKLEMISKPLIIPYSLHPNFTFNNSEYESYYTDMFPIENIIEIEVKVEEINPKKIKIEELQKVLTDNKDDIKKVLEAISDAL